MSNSRYEELHPILHRWNLHFQHFYYAIFWLNFTIDNAIVFHEQHHFEHESSPFGVRLPDSSEMFGLTLESLYAISDELKNTPPKTPIITQSLSFFYNSMTIVLWLEIRNSSLYENIKHYPETLFLNQLRNASAHNNLFYFSEGRQRENTLKKFPISWRTKIIQEDIEEKTLYFEFMTPGELVLLVHDISKRLYSEDPSFEHPTD
jgi:hypothetical protein